MATEKHKPKDAAISAAPTKSFFVEMLTRDIPLEQAILDLVDNAVDGATRINPSTFEGRTISISISKSFFRIVDNCGGFSKEIAKTYAFRFGRPKGTPNTPHSIGQFGVGMKRALFKFGNHFRVSSATETEEWAIDVDVQEWVSDTDDWHFSWSPLSKGTEHDVSRAHPGTDITVEELRPEIADRFGSQQFENSILALIKSKHRQFISQGLSISLNGKHVDATSVYLLQDKRLQAGIDNLSFGSGKTSVKVRIVVGIGPSSPREAGWYVICNGRVILDADRRDRTGWGLVEQGVDSEQRVVIPSFHNQFARFRGIVSFDSQDASQLPWNTTKTDIDDGNIVWQKTFQRMSEMMRPAITFLNELDKDVDEHTREGSALYEYVTSAAKTSTDELTRKSEFRAPARQEVKEKHPVSEDSVFTPQKGDCAPRESIGIELRKICRRENF